MSKDSAGCLELSRAMEILGSSYMDLRRVEPAFSMRSGIPSLDRALGGGLPTGFVEIYGPESVGKTTLGLTIARFAQEKGLKVGLCGNEYVDEPYMTRLGVDTSNLLSIRGPGQAVLWAAGDLLNRHLLNLLIVDSASTLRPGPEDLEDSASAWRSMLLDWMSFFGPCIGLGCCVILINQCRAKISVSPTKMFAGGTCSVAQKIAGMFDARLELSRTSVTETSYEMIVAVVANTLARPARIFSLPVEKGYGIDLELDLIRTALSLGLIEDRASRVYYGDHLLGHGQRSAAMSLRANKNFREELMSKIA